MRSRGMGRGWALVAMVGVGGACEGTHEVDQSDGASVLDVSGDGWGDVDEWVDTTPDTRVDLDGVDSDGAIGVDAGDGTADDSIADDGSAPDRDTRDASVSSDASDATGTDDADARDASGTDASDATAADDADGSDASDASSDVATDAGVDTVVPAPREPLVAYVQGGARALYFLNNPEQIVTSDLGDAALGDKTLYRVTARGLSRSFFEHLNKTGRTIGFGVQLYNPGPGAVEVAVSGVGWVVGLDGGVPFRQAEAGEGATTLSLLSGKSSWILRKDEVVPNGSFFSGVVDYNVQGGSVVVNHVAYDAFGNLDGSTSELGYVQRIEPDGTHEARMYKGTATASEAAFEATFAVRDADSGALAVRTRRWDTGSGQWLAPVLDEGWTTHIGPGQNAGATVSDMVSFVLGAWRFDPLVASDGEGRFPNLGNWGVTYRGRFVVENQGTRSRRVTWRLAASPGAGAAFAKGVAGVWSAVRLAAGAETNLAAVDVPAGGSAVLEASMVLGGPSGGALRQSLRVD